MGSLARAALLLGLLVVAGCGSAGSSGSFDDGGLQWDLAITFWPQGKQHPSRTATLECAPNGGTHPDPAEACAALDDHPEALHPVPADVACTEIYGGDQVALVEGNGIRALFNRTNGCEIARWDALAPVLEFPG